jgi:CubicO group peptidase (beta-lactamase class C family)
MNNARWFGCVCALALSPTLLACGSSDSDSNKTAPVLDFTAFDSAMTSFLQANDLAGASAVVVHKDWGVVHTSGYGDYDADRLYVIASSSKVLSVGVLMRLADQGKLDIDAPIGNYLKDWTGNKPELEVAQLVSNSSGLVGLIDNPTYGPYLCQYIDSGTLADCAKAIYDADDAADRKPPDTEFHYGGGQWQLAGGIAEAIGGKPWADLIRETYSEPCGLTTLGYTNQYTKASATGGVAAALAYPTFFDGDVKDLPVSANPSIEGGAYITAPDYGKVLLMHLRGGMCDGNRVLSEQAVTRMQQDRILEKYDGVAPDPTTEGYGLGWWIDRVHTGVVADAGAYGAMPWIDNDREYGAFVVLQSNAGVGVNLRTAVKPVLDAVFDDAEAK